VTPVTDRRLLTPGFVMDLFRPCAVGATARERLAPWLRLVSIAAFTAVSTFWLMLILPGAVGTDVLVYRAGASEIIGGDPWAASHQGMSFAAPPLEAFAFLPATLVPEDVFVGVWVLASAIGALVIVRRLSLPAWWLLYPPLVAGVIGSNPAVLGMAAVVAGWRLVGVILRPQLIMVVGWRAATLFAALSVGAILLRPDFITGLVDNIARYQIQSGSPINFWLSPLMVPAMAALVLLWRVDRHAASWLVMPAVGPAMGWYGFTMVMPVRSLPLALACIFPVPGLGAAAITLYALWRWWCRGDGARAGPAQSPPDPGATRPD
jgi:hypothetical protein